MAIYATANIVLVRGFGIQYLSSAWDTDKTIYIEKLAIYEVSTVQSTVYHLAIRIFFDNAPQMWVVMKEDQLSKSAAFFADTNIHATF